MNPSLRRNTCENAVNKEPIGSTVETTSKPESKTPVISYNYEAAISQPDIPIYSKIDNNTQKASWSEPSGESSAPTQKKNLHVCGKAGVTTTKRGIVFKSKVQAKKVAKTRQSIYNVAEIKKESIPSAEIIRNVENYGQEISDSIITNRQTPSNLHQKNLVHSRNVPKTSGIAKNDEKLANKAVGVFQENSDKIDRDRRLCIPQNKISKIPRIKLPIKPNSFHQHIHGESRIYPNPKLSAWNELKCSTDMKSSTDNEEEKLIFDSNREPWNAVNYQQLKTKNILPTVHENSNLWCPEKSSEMDADEEFEGDLPTPKESPSITGAGDDPRSVTLLKSLALKCECRSCNDHKYASTVRVDQRTETESWSSPEMESARKWKSMRHRKSVNVSSEDLDSSDYNAINYGDGKMNKKDNGSNLASHNTKPSSIVNRTRMKTHRTTSFSFFNVFFDIVFWPFVFLRPKQ